MEDLLTHMVIAAILRQLHPITRTRQVNAQNLPTVAAGPLVIIRTRSESSTASSTSWVINTMVVFSSC